MPPQLWPEMKGVARNRHPLLFLGPLAVCVAAAAPSASAAEPSPMASVPRLVIALGSGRLAARDAAERALLALGPAALPAITEAGAGAVGEAAFRLRGIRRSLEEQAAAEAVAGGDVTVTLAGVEPTGGEAATGARIRLRIGWEEGRPPLVLTLPLASVVAEGDHGEAMQPAQRAAVIEAAIPADRAWVEVPIVLGQPSPPLESLAVLRGTVNVWLTGMEHAFTFSGLDARAAGSSPRRSLRLGQATVSIDELVRRQDRLLVTATIHYDTPTEALASHRSWLARRPLELLAADGQPVAPLSQVVRSRSERGLTATAEFPAHAGGERLRWRLPIAIHEVPVDFAIRHIPLPPRRDPR
jgi:hypothetical protein